MQCKALEVVSQLFEAASSGDEVNKEAILCVDYTVTGIWGDSGLNIFDTM